MGQPSNAQNSSIQNPVPSQAPVAVPTMAQGRNANKTKKHHNKPTGKGKGGKGKHDKGKHGGKQGGKGGKGKGTKTIGQPAPNTGGASGSDGDGAQRALRKAIKSQRRHLEQMEKAAHQNIVQDGDQTVDDRTTSYTQDSGHRNLQDALNSPLVTGRAAGTARSKAQTRPTATKAGPPTRQLRQQDSIASNISQQSDASMVSAVATPSLSGSTPLAQAVCTSIADIAQDLLVKAQANELTKERVLFIASTLSLAASS